MHPLINIEDTFDIIHTVEKSLQNANSATLRWWRLRQSWRPDLQHYSHSKVKMQTDSPRYSKCPKCMNVCVHLKRGLKYYQTYRKDLLAHNHTHRTFFRHNWTIFPPNAPSCCCWFSSEEFVFQKTDETCKCVKKVSSEGKKANL